MRKLLLVSWLLSSMADTLADFPIPGLAPVEFKKGDKIKVEAIELTSTQRPLPYAYYSLPFCRPKNDKFENKSGNLSEALRGDRFATAYDVRMLEDVQCKILCHDPHSPMSWEEAMSKDVINKIEHEYFVHL